MKVLKSIPALVFCTMLAFGLAACGGSDDGGGNGGGTSPGPYTIGGTVTGLSGIGLVLRNNGSDDLAIGSDGSFTFAAPVDDEGNYSVTVLTQPTGPGQTCTVNGGTGTVAGADVTNISVTCSTNAYTVGGTITGLSGTSLVLRNNSGDDLPITSNGSFTFASPVADGAGFEVTVPTQPSSPNQTCTVNGGTGTVAGANVSDISVTCSTISYTVGGMLSGLEGNSVILRNNGTDYLDLYADGPFTFAVPVADGAEYAVTVGTQPSSPNQTCTINSGTGTLAGGDVTDVTVTCSTISYTIGGTASGVTGDVVLQNNSGDNLTISADGPFTFATPVADTAGYDVTALSSLGLACTLANESGTVNGADVSDVTLACSPVSVSVEPFYSASGVDWNDYVFNDGLNEFTATDTTCDPSQFPEGLEGYDSCLHGGEMRAVEVPGLSSCARLTASDDLGAFDWVCDDSTFPVRMVSTGLKDGKNLSDLLDFATPGWKDNDVTVKDGGAVHFSTAPAAWWSNPVVVDNDGGNLDGAGTIYVVTNDDLATSGTGYIINAPSVGLVAQPGVIINGPAAGAASYVVSADGSLPGQERNFLWLEGAVDAAGDEVGVRVYYTQFSVFSDVTVENADAGLSPIGIDLRSSANNKLTGVGASNNSDIGIVLGSGRSTISEVTASNNGGHGIVLDILNGFSYSTVSGVMASHNGGYGIALLQVRENTFTGVTTSNNGGDGLYFTNSCRRNTLTGVTASNNGGSGVYIGISAENTLHGVTTANNNGDGVRLAGSANNGLSRITASNNGGNGVYISGTSDSNTLSDVTAMNNNVGIHVWTSSDNTLSAVTASNNNSYGIYLDAASDSTLSGVTSSDNGSNGLRLYNVANGYFTGLLNVGNNGADDCFVTGGTNPGLVDVTCTETGLDGSSTYGIGNISDATLSTGVTLASSFVGKLYDDVVNSSDTGSAVAYPPDPATFDWSIFENAFRGWGRDGTFGLPDSRSQWLSGGSGAIWDWSLLLNDTVIKDALALPTGNDTLTHTWYTAYPPASQTDCSVLNPDYVFVVDHCETTYLRNAVEIEGDGIGNDNTLCESNETCLSTSNIASYQGHGNLVEAGYIGNGGTIENVILKQYEINGY